MQTARLRWTALIAFVGTVTFVAGCSGDRKLSLSLPDMGSADALILGIEQEGEVLHVSAHAIERGDAEVHVEVDADLGAPAIIQVLAYGRSLSDLGFQPGVLQIRREGGDVTTEIPPPDLWVQVSSVTSGEWSGWQSAEGPSSAMRGLRVERSTPCVDLDEVDLPIPSQTPLRVSVMIPLSERAVLIATEEGKVFEYSAAGLVEHTELSTTTFYRSAFLQDDGTLWLVRFGGVVVHGRLGGTFQSAPARLPAPLSDWYWITGSKGTAPFEVFVLDSWGELQRFDGAQWSAIDDPLRSATAPHGLSGLVWTGPGQLAFVTPIDNVDLFELLALERRLSGILRLSDGLITEDTFPFEPSESPSVLADVESLGLVVGTLTGGLYRNNGTRWAPVTGSPLKVSIRSIIPLDQGALFGGSDGVAQYHPGFGFCGQRTFDHGPVEHMAPFEGGALVGLAPQVSSGPDRVVRLRRGP